WAACREWTKTPRHLVGGGPLPQAAGRPPQAPLPRRGLTHCPFVACASAPRVRAEEPMARRNPREIVPDATSTAASGDLRRPPDVAVGGGQVFARGGSDSSVRGPAPAAG